MTVNELLDIWMREKQVYSLKQRTFMRYADLIRTQIVPAIGNVPLEQLTSSALQSFQRQKLTDGNSITGRPLANNTVKNIMSILRGALLYGREEKQLDVLSPESVPFLRFNEKPVEAFRKDEQRKIEQTVAKDGKANHFGIVLCLYTGLRLGELLALTWKDIDFTASTLTVDKTSAFYKGTDGKYTIHISRPKTESSVRVIPVPKPVMQELKRIYRKSKSEYVITTNKGGRVTNRSYQTTYAKVLKRAGVKYRNFHVLRHTFATRALECGMDIKTLSEIMGHKSPAVTLNRYAHSLMETKRKMMDHLAKSLGFGAQKKSAV